MKRLVDRIHELATQLDIPNDDIAAEGMIGVVQNWLDDQRGGALERYGVGGAHLIDDLKRFAEAGL